MNKDGTMQQVKTDTIPDIAQFRRFQFKVVHLKERDNEGNIRTVPFIEQRCMVLPLDNVDFEYQLANNPECVYMNEVARLVQNKHIAVTCSRIARHVWQDNQFASFRDFDFSEDEQSKKMFKNLQLVARLVLRPDSLCSKNF